MQIESSKINYNSPFQEKCFRIFSKKRTSSIALENLKMEKRAYTGMKLIPKIMKHLDNKTKTVAQAVQEIERIILTENGNKEVQELRGEFGNHLLSAKCYEEALVQFQKAQEVGVPSTAVLLGLARAAYAIKDYKKVIAICDSIINIKSDPPTDFYKLKTLALFSLKKFSDAINASIDIEFTERLKDDEVLFVVGASNFHLGKFFDANFYLNSLLEINPEHNEALLKRAECLYQLNEFEKALADFNKIHENEATEQSLIGKCRCLSSLGQLESALGELDRYMQKFDSFTLNYTKAQCYIENKKYQQAIELLDQLIAKDSQRWKLYFYRGTCHEKLGNEKQAESDISMAQTFEDHDYQIYSYLGHRAKSKRETEKCAKLFQEAIKRGERSNPIIAEYAKTLLELGQMEGAIKTFEILYKAAPTPQNSFYLAEAYYQNYLSGNEVNLDETTFLYNFAISSQNCPSSAYFHRGQIQALNKQYDLALEDYTKASNLGYNPTLVYQGRIELYIEQKKYSEAEKECEEARALGIHQNCINLYLAKTYRSKGRLHEAIAILNQVILQSDSDELVNAYLELGALYESQKEETQAILAYERARKNCSKDQFQQLRQCFCHLLKLKLRLATRTNILEPILEELTNGLNEYKTNPKSQSYFTEFLQNLGTIFSSKKLLHKTWKSRQASLFTYFLGCLQSKQEISEQRASLVANSYSDTFTLMNSKLEILNAFKAYLLSNELPLTYNVPNTFIAIHFENYRDDDHEMAVKNLEMVLDQYIERMEKELFKALNEGRSYEFFMKGFSVNPCIEGRLSQIEEYNSSISAIDMDTIINLDPKNPLIGNLAECVRVYKNLKVKEFVENRPEVFGQIDFSSLSWKGAHGLRYQLFNELHQMASVFKQEYFTRELVLEFIREQNSPLLSPDDQVETELNGLFDLEGMF